MMYRDPKLIIKLEARCHTYEDALKLQSMLADLVSNNDLAGEYIEECSIFYINPLNHDVLTNEKIITVHDEIEELEIAS